MDVNPAVEASEREAKRLRIHEPGAANFVFSEVEPTFAFMATAVPKFLEQHATAHYVKHDVFFEENGISLREFLFGVKRNDFYDKYEALAANDQQQPPQKKKGRKEIKLSELSPQQQRLFTGPLTTRNGKLGKPKKPATSLAWRKAAESGRRSPT